MPESRSPLQDAIAEAAKLPSNELRVGAVAENGDAGAEVQFEKTLGAHGELGVEASWWKRAGYRAAAYLGWKL